MFIFLLGLLLRLREDDDETVITAAAAPSTFNPDVSICSDLHVVCNLLIVAVICELDWLLLEVVEEDVERDDEVDEAEDNDDDDEEEEEDVWLLLLLVRWLLFSKPLLESIRLLWF